MNEQRSHEPHDRLTRLCAAMTEAMEAHPESQGDEKCIVLLHDDEDSGIQMHGYEDDVEAIADLLIHLRAIFRANGKDLTIVPLLGGPNS
jgi:hypothetical protein